MTFAAAPFSQAPAGRWDIIAPVWLDKQSIPTMLLANGKELRSIGGKLSLATTAISPNGLLPVDWNNDFRTDLLLAGGDGLRFFEQQSDGSFAEVTAKTGLAADVLHGDYAGAWAADVDLDGDMDIVVARRTGSPLLLQNNFDGTFTSRPVFEKTDGARAFAWADLDRDGAAGCRIARCARWSADLRQRALGAFSTLARQAPGRQIRGSDGRRHHARRRA